MSIDKNTTDESKFKVTFLILISFFSLSFIIFFLYIVISSLSNILDIRILSWTSGLGFVAGLVFWLILTTPIELVLESLCVILFHRKNDLLIHVIEFPLFVGYIHMLDRLMTGITLGSQVTEFAVALAVYIGLYSVSQWGEILKKKGY